MEMNEELKERIEAKFGRKIATSRDCEALAKDIAEVTGKEISVTTIKRMFGSEDQTPQLESTLAILSDYVNQYIPKHHHFNS